MNRLSFRPIVICLLITVACASPATPRPIPTLPPGSLADTILVNGRMVVMDSANTSGNAAFDARPQLVVEYYLGGAQGQRASK